MKPLAHFHATMGDEDGSVSLVNVDDGAGLVEELEGEGDAELGGCDGDAPLAVGVCGVEFVHGLAPGLQAPGRGEGVLPASPGLTVLDHLPIVRHISRLDHIALDKGALVDPGRRRQALDDAFDDHHALGSAESPEGRVAGHVGLADGATGPHVGDAVHAVQAEERPIHDGTRKIERVAPVAVQLNVDCLNDTIWRACGPVIGKERVPVACDAHIHVSVDDQGHGLVEQERRNGGNGVQKGGSRLLATKATPDSLCPHDDAV
mmetsp:Transcript_9214/g.24838  ORF Transcript_9214/g.24838 Transcript_9214/m.24838 type:complete len:262 (+) Transcript_9214:786-1571(+)